MNPPPLPPPPLETAVRTPGWRWGRVALAVLPWAFAALMLVPSPWRAVFFAPGRFREWVGLPCPLCGGTRAMAALLSGDGMRSLYLNPLALLALVAGVLWTAACLWESWRGRDLVPGLERRVARAGKWILIGLGVFWVYHAGMAWWWPKEELLDRTGWIFRAFP